MTIALPDRESIELLHDAVLSYSGGRAGIHDENLIISAVERPLTYVEYVESYDLDTICALIIDSVARYHGYKDGNKRTALLMAIFAYRVNEVHFKATQEMNVDFDDLVMWVVIKKPGIDKISNRLKQLREIHEGNEEPWSAMFTAFRNAMSIIRHK
jgi:death-on-curing protein